VTSIINWMLFLLLNGLVVYSSYRLASYLNRKNEILSVVIVATGIVYFAQITVIILFLGVVLRYLNLASVTVTSLLLSLVLIYFFRRERYPVGENLRHAMNELVASRDYVLYGFVLLFLLQTLILLAKVIVLPPHVWDVFYYHLTPAVEWYQRGWIPPVIETPASHMNKVPLGMTVLSYWFFIFFRHDFLVELPMLLWALLLVPLAFAMLRKSDVPLAWALKFSILVFFIPIVLMQAITVKDHLGLNIAFLSGLLFLACYLQEGRSRQLVLAGFAFGLMLGYKQASMAYLLVASLLFFTLLIINRRDFLRQPAPRRAFLGGAFTAIFLSGLIGGYWWVKKFLDAGVKGLAALPPPRPAVGADGEAGRFGLDAFFSNLGEFFIRIFDYRAPYGADLPGISGFGPQFAAFGLLALFAGLVLVFFRSERHRPFYLILVSSLSLFILFLFARYSVNSNSYRILSFLPMTMLVYAAILLHRQAWFQRKSIAWAVNLVSLGSVLWVFAFILPPAYTNPMLFREYISMDPDFRTSGTYTKWFVVHRPSLYRLLPAMPQGEPVAIVSQPVFGQWFRKGQVETWSYPYYDRRWQRRLVYFYDKPYLECERRRHVCRPTMDLKKDLIAAGMRLVSSCPTNRCVAIHDRDFIELAPGFYYFRGEEKRD